MGPSWWQILIVLVLLVLLFGRGKISGLMSDVAQGIKSFKVGIADDVEPNDAKHKVGYEAASVKAPKKGTRAEEVRG